MRIFHSNKRIHIGLSCISPPTRRFKISSLPCFGISSGSCRLQNKRFEWKLTFLFAFLKIVRQARRATAGQKASRHYAFIIGLVGVLVGLGKKTKILLANACQVGQTRAFGWSIDGAHDMGSGCLNVRILAGGNCFCLCIVLGDVKKIELIDAVTLRYVLSPAFVVFLQGQQAIKRCSVVNLFPIVHASSFQLPQQPLDDGTYTPSQGPLPCPGAQNSHITLSVSFSEPSLQSSLHCSRNFFM